MKKALFSAILISIFLGGTALSGFAASEHEAHHPGGKSASASSSMMEMMPQGMDMGQMMNCMEKQGGASKISMMGMMKGGMGDMMGGGMHKMMGHGKQGMMQMLYLDRVEELGLTADQVNQLKAIHSECRRENIRNAAEAKIARLDLADLLSGDDWSLADAEALVRKIQQLEADIQLRHLQGISDARKVLTDEQLKRAHSAGSSADLEELFQ